MPLGVNPLKSSRFYQHADVFCHVPHLSCPVDKDVLYEFTGLAVPFRYDCNLCGSIFGIPCRHNNGDGAMIDHAQAWSAHDYYSAAPSRRHACNLHAANLLSKFEYSSPSLPLIDEEYEEQAMLLTAILKVARCSRSNTKYELAIFEAGARWGTWGFRGLALARLISPLMRARAVFWEPDPRHRGGLKKVAAINGFETSYQLFPDVFRTSTLLSASSDVKVIHYLDLDIQGGEANLCQDRTFLDIVTAKVMVLKIGTHSPAIHTTLAKCLPKLLPTFNLTKAERFGQDRFNIKLHLYKRQDFFTIRTQGLFEQGAFGPIINCDGTLVLENTRLFTKGC